VDVAVGRLYGGDEVAGVVLASGGRLVCLWYISGILDEVDRDFLCSKLLQFEESGDRDVIIERSEFLPRPKAMTRKQRKK